MEWGGDSSEKWTTVDTLQWSKKLDYEKRENEAEGWDEEGGNLGGVASKKKRERWCTVGEMLISWRANVFWRKKDETDEGKKKSECADDGTRRGRKFYRIFTIIHNFRNFSAEFLTFNTLTSLVSALRRQIRSIYPQYAHLNYTKLIFASCKHQISRRWKLFVQHKKSLFFTSTQVTERISIASSRESCDVGAVRKSTTGKLIWWRFHHPLARALTVKS